MVKTLYMEINIVKQLFGHSILHVMYGEDVRGGGLLLWFKSVMIILFLPCISLWQGKGY